MAGRRTKEKLNRIINEYLKRHEIFEEDAPWIIKESPLGGFGVFTSRNVQKGDIIFKDYPVLLGPRCLEKAPKICVNCFSKVNPKSCSEKCGLLVCSPACEKAPTHRADCSLIKSLQNENAYQLHLDVIMKCLTPLKSLTLSKDDKEVVLNLKAHKGSRHGHEVQVLTKQLKFHLHKEEEAFMRFVCSVLDANAFEVLVGNEEDQSSIRGLYPLGSLANHRCYPNAYHVFDDRQRMVVRAGVDMKKDTEIFHCYSRIIWGTITRSIHLRNTKHFICKCERCLDPTEFGTYMSCILCETCKGKVVPVDPLKKSDWQCQNCQNTSTFQEVGRILAMIGSVLRSFNDSDFKIMYRFLTEKVCNLVPEHSQIVVEIKYKIIWIIGHKPGYLWPDLPLDLLLVKKSFCEDILTLLEKLNIGLCKMRGLLLYEKYLCLQEIEKRQTVQHDNSGESSSFLYEAADILKYDVTAPELIKNTCH